MTTDGVVTRSVGKVLVSEVLVSKESGLRNFGTPPLGASRMALTLEGFLSGLPRWSCSTNDERLVGARRIAFQGELR